MYEISVPSAVLMLSISCRMLLCIYSMTILGNFIHLFLFFCTTIKALFYHLFVGSAQHTTPIWDDECRASITAAKITPNLTRKEQSDLIMDAVYRANEFGQLIEMDNFMKEVVYGYATDEKRVIGNITPINYVSKESQTGTEGNRESDSDLSQMWETSRDYEDFER